MMKNIFNVKNKPKKPVISIFILSIILLTNGLHPVYGATNQELAKTEDAYYMPMRFVWEDNGGEVLYNGAQQEIEIKTDFWNIVYDIDAQSYQKNANEHVLIHPLEYIDGMYYIHYDDVSFLFAGENDVYKETKKEIIPMIYQSLVTEGIPGLTLSFIDAAIDYSYVRGFGFADVENKIFSTADTQFSVASMSKHFTALGVMQLVEAGELNLEAPVTTYLPSFNLKAHPVYGGQSENVTLRMLLSHRGGIYTDVYEYFNSKEKTDPLYVNQFLDNYNGHYMQGTENERTVYSNAGFSLLGIIVAKTQLEKEDTFQGFNNFMEERIFAPLDMGNSAFSGINGPNMAQSYKKVGEKVDFSVSNAAPAGGLITTGKDMKNYMTMLLNDGEYKDTKILSKASMDAMMEVPSFQDPFNKGFLYGLGTLLVDYNNTRYFGHSGDLYYAHSAFFIEPETKLGAFVAINSGAGGQVPTLIALQLLDSAIDENKEKPEITFFPAVEAITVKEDLKSYGGFYNGLGKIEILDTGEIYFVESDEKLSPVEENLYPLEGIGHIRFGTLDDIDVITWVEADDYIIYQRVLVEKAKTDSQYLLGDYEVKKNYPNEDPLFTSASIVEDSFGNLGIIIGGLTVAPFYLSYIDENLFYIPGVSRNLGQVVAFSQTEDTISFSYFNVVFEKQVSP